MLCFLYKNSVRDAQSYCLIYDFSLASSFFFRRSRARVPSLALLLPHVLASSRRTPIKATTWTGDACHLRKVKRALLIFFLLSFRREIRSAIPEATSPIDPTVVSTAPVIPDASCRISGIDFSRTVTVWTSSRTPSTFSITPEAIDSLGHIRRYIFQTFLQTTGNADQLKQQNRKSN